MIRFQKRNSRNLIVLNQFLFYKIKLRMKYRQIIRTRNTGLTCLRWLYLGVLRSEVVMTISWLQRAAPPRSLQVTRMVQVVLLQSPDTVNCLSDTGTPGYKWLGITECYCVHIFHSAQLKVYYNFLKLSKKQFSI